MGDKVKLVSFHSLSKGILGECGIRGGYMEFNNFTQEEIRDVKKEVSDFAPNLYGQVGMCFMARYKTEALRKTVGDEIFSKIKKEYEKIF